MRSRRASREAALQVLYQCDTLGEWHEGSSEEFIQHFGSSNSNENPSTETSQDNEQFFHKVANGALYNIERIDSEIGLASTHWSVARMSRIDRNILRVGTYEILFCSEIPLRVIINEAIEIAKRYGSEDSPTFVNGVLDKIAATAKRESQDSVHAGAKRVVNGS